MLGIDGQAGHYSHFGIEKGLTDLLQEHSVSSGVMSLQFNFDGLPLFKSAKMELWPLLCLAKSVHRTPFVVGLYCGPKKPASVSDCLHELCSLLMNGCTCVTKDTIKLKLVVLYAMPQHGLLSRILNPIAYHGCDKCIQEGIFVNRRMTFPETNADLQKDDEFNSMTDEAHHRGSMPLSALPTGLVTSFVFDYALGLSGCYAKIGEVLVGWACAQCTATLMILLVNYVPTVLGCCLKD